MIHINRFIDKITSAEAKNLKHVNLSIQDAKGLHADITKLLLVLQELQTTRAEDAPDKVQQVEISGGNW